MQDQKITVSEQHCAVHIYLMANHVWIADGEFLGGQLRARGNTAEEAMSAWRRAAANKHLLASNVSQR
jgi:hypothetical protein